MASGSSSKYRRSSEYRRDIVAELALQAGDLTDERRRFIAGMRERIRAGRSVRLNAGSH
jgi:hypothetical protein